MLPGRRTAAVTMLALLAVAGLAACRSDPAVIAYVGDTEITEARVDGVIGELRSTYEGQIETGLEQLAEQGQSEDAVAEQRRQQTEQLDTQLLDARNVVATLLVLTEAGNRYAAAEGLDVPEPDLADAAQRVTLDRDHAYTEVVAGFLAVQRALQEQADSAEPSEADRREAFANLSVNGQPADVPYAQAAPMLTAETLGGPVGMRDLLTTVVADADVRVQPGYELVYEVPVQVPQQQQARSWLGVRISGPSSVVDRE